MERAEHNLRIAPAFSLMEVLIAVVILALGLLGLGAVLPVVVREQRLATEATLGVAAENSARVVLERHRLLSGPIAPGGPTGWRDWRDAVIGEANGWFVPQTDPLTGAVHFRAAAPEIRLTVADRLFPAPFASEGSTASAPSEPRLIWDIAARRVAPDDDGDGVLETSDADPVEVVLFVRAIDPGIAVRRERGESLSALLVQWPGAAADQWVLPLALDVPTGRPATPTRRHDISRQVYPPPAVIREVRVLRRDRLEFDQATVEPPEVDPLLAQQPGQRLVDTRGRIYTVLGRGEAGADREDFVRIEPPIPAEVPAGTRLEFVFTPQVPVAVATFRVYP